MVVNELAEYPERDQDNTSSEVLLPEQETHVNALPSAPPSQKVVLYCPLPGQVHYLKGWLTKHFVDHFYIFHIYPDMGNDEHTEMQLKSQH